MEVVIPILAATGLILAGKKQNNGDMLNRETLKQAKEAKKEAFTNMGQGRINPQNILSNTNDNIYLYRSNLLYFVSETLQFLSTTI